MGLSPLDTASAQLRHARAVQLSRFPALPHHGEPRERLFLVYLSVAGPVASANARGKALSRGALFNG